MKSQIACPKCRKPATWEENPHRPFCSERCKLIDLGQWADGSYRIPSSPQEQLSDEDVVQINTNEQDFEG
jgi:endogenous inhibitor of DNA gyrase (YacG/DUF329 family)